MEVIKKGSRGEEVLDIKMRLTKLGYNLRKSQAENLFDEVTSQAAKNFQQDQGLLPSGQVDEKTWQALVRNTYELGERLLYLKTPFLKGKDVKKLQQWLNKLGFPVGPVDGIFGPETSVATREFQKNTGLSADGIVGSATLEAFFNLRRILEAGPVVEYPEKGRKASLVAIFRGEKVAIDFGLKDRQAKVVCQDIGLRLGNLVELLGGEPIFLGREEKTLSPLEKAKVLNKISANFLISLDLNKAILSKKTGATTYYFAASQKEFSEGGKALGRSIQKELVSLLRRGNGGLQGEDLTILKKTKMPAVLVKPAYLTNHQEKALLNEEDFRQKIAVAIFDGLKNFLEKSATK